MRRALRVALAASALAVGVALALALRAPPPLQATPATLHRLVEQARGGDVIELAAGDYGTFRGARKAATVTLRGRSDAAARMDVQLDGASFLRFENLTVRSAELIRSDHVEFTGNRFTGPALIDTTGRNGDHAILFDGNSHRGIDVCSRCHEGRVTVIGDASNTRPVGVTIRNSFFGDGGNSDGVQVGSYGVRIVGNEFAGLRQGDPELAHTDAIQLYGQSHTVVRRNYLHDVATGIMAADGADHELIEDNVIVTGGYPWGIVLGPDNGSTIRHNTLPDGACSWNLRCGTLRICSTCNPARPSRDTSISDNVLGALSVEAASSLAEEDYNLIAVGGGSGGHDLSGAAAFAGGPTPGDVAGFALDDASPGKGAASDGGDPGAKIEDVGRSSD